MNIILTTYLRLTLEYSRSTVSVRLNCNFNYTNVKSCHDNFCKFMAQASSNLAKRFALYSPNVVLLAV